MKPSTPTPHNGPPTARTWATHTIEQKDANQQALDRKQRILKAAAIPPCSVQAVMARSSAFLYTALKICGATFDVRAIQRSPSGFLSYQYNISSTDSVAKTVAKASQRVSACSEAALCSAQRCSSRAHHSSSVGFNTMEFHTGVPRAGHPCS